MFTEDFELDTQARLLEECYEMRTHDLLGAEKLNYDDVVTEALAHYRLFLLDRLYNAKEIKDYKEELIREHQEKL